MSFKSRKAGVRGVKRIQRSKYTENDEQIRVIMGKLSKMDEYLANHPAQTVTKKPSGNYHTHKFTKFR